MSDFLSDEWATMMAGFGADLPELVGPDGEALGAIVGFEIVDAPGGGKLRAHVVIEAGRITDVVLAKSKEAGCTVTLSAELAAGLLRDEVDAPVAYMRGDIKLADNYELVLFDLRAFVATSEFADFRSSVIDNTTF